jgi:MFS family permease
MHQPRLSGLWRHSDFRKLWTAHTIAQFGTQITFLAMPLTAILILDATAAQMGLLMAAMTLPALLIGLFVGVWVDRLQRRALLIASDIGRAILLVVVPLLAWFDLLRIEHLYVLAFLFGSLTLVFDIAYRSYLPSLIQRSQLVDGNSKLELSRSAAEIGGPGIAGGLIQIASAPFAILVHAVSLLVSAAFLGTIQAPESTPEREPDRRVLREIREGLGFVFGNGVLRALAGCAASLGFFNAILEVVLLLYIAQELGLSPGVIGLVFAAGNIGFLTGALLPERLMKWIGLGPALGAGLLISGVGDVLVPLAGGPYILMLAILATAQFMFGLGFVIFKVNEVSLRQALTPDRLQGRMNATMSLMLNGIVPAGALAGGLLGVVLGLKTTLLIAATGEIMAILWLVLSPVWSLKTHPAPLETS